MNIFTAGNYSKDDDAEMIRLWKQNLKITDLKGHQF